MFIFYTEKSIQRGREFNQQAVEGMRIVHGRDHLRTQVACENLCMTAVRTGDPKHLEEAKVMMEEVLKVRKEKLGKEHGFTLVAIVNLSCVESALGNLYSAEKLLLSALDVGERGLGRDHQACLWGRYLLGKLWLKRGQHERVVPCMVDVTTRQSRMLQGRSEHHPDHLGGLVDLATAYHTLGKPEDRDRVALEALEALEGFEQINGSQHPIAKQVRTNMERWKQEQVT
jgi:hypothetical protein